MKSFIRLKFELQTYPIDIKSPSLKGKAPLPKVSEHFRIPFAEERNSAYYKKKG